MGKKNPVKTKQNQTLQNQQQPKTTYQNPKVIVIKKKWIGNIVLGF